MIPTSDYWTPERVESFRRDGYSLVPGAVGPSAVDRALRLVNANLRTCGLAPERWQHYESTSFCETVRADPAITALLTDSQAWPIIEAALGAGTVAPPAHGQVALRFPEDTARRLDPHLDGIHSRGNRIAPGTLNNFTLLAGVLLSNLPDPWSGNFTVWPGSHVLNWHHYSRHGVDGFPGGLSQVGEREPTQILGQAGDVVISHYFLGHGAATNTSARIRYAVYFRVRTLAFDPSAGRSALWWGWDGPAFGPAHAGASPDRSRGFGDDP